VLPQTHTDEKTILKWIIREKGKGIQWIQQAQDKIKYPNTVMNVQNPMAAVKFLRNFPVSSVTDGVWYKFLLMQYILNKTKPNTYIS